jgi:hypothetical protein
MNALAHQPSREAASSFHAPARAGVRALPQLACEPESAWEARGFGELVPPATLVEARTRRDDLAKLLGREREAAADFLLALADFDRRRGWERLGHASLFAFLTRELKLSKGAAYLRFTAARLLPRHPAVEQALRAGQLCLSAVGELSRVLTPQNEAEVLPRFLGCSAREAREVVAALAPAPAPPRREVVTLLPSQARARSNAAPLVLQMDASCARPLDSVDLATSAPAVGAGVLTSEPPPAAPARAPRAEVEPMTADLRRLHLTVSAGFLEKVASARTGLSHAMPRASMEQVLEAALDLLLEKQARRKALVKRPRAARPTSTPTSPPLTPSGVPLARSPGDPAGERPDLPAAVEREVRLRDGNRCQWPLDSGGVCGSTWQVELDHVVPQALGGPTEAANLRCACKVHNLGAAVLALGEGLVASARAWRRRQ